MSDQEYAFKISTEELYRCIRKLEKTRRREFTKTRSREPTALRWLRGQVGPDGILWACMGEKFQGEYRKGQYQRFSCHMGTYTGAEDFTPFEVCGYRVKQLMNLLRGSGWPTMFLLVSRTQVMFDSRCHTRTFKFINTECFRYRHWA